VRFWIPDASKPSKAKERVSSAAEKIVILVSGHYIRYWRCACLQLSLARRGFAMNALQQRHRTDPSVDMVL
jgi:hypothetical protein